MSWRDKMQMGSFRGVQFYTESDDGGFGRRGKLFEYPGRDKPYREDIGRKARERSLTCFVIGDDYMEQRDRLLEAIETAGPGELVHPWYGRMTVSIEVCRVSHSIKEGGMCRFQISFVESGDLSFPTSASAPGAKSLRAVDAVQAAAAEDFSNNFTIENMPAYGVDDAITQAGSMLDTMSKKLGTVGTILSDPLSALKDQIGTSLNTPLTFANSVFGIFAQGEAVLTAASGLRDINSLNFLRAFTTLRLSSSFTSSSSNTATSTRAQISANQTALNTLARQALLVQTAGMTATMPLPVYDDAVSLRSELLTAIDSEAAVANDTTYRALVDLRASVYEDMTSRIQGASKLQEVTPMNVSPALVLAYDLYGDVDRESEILDRNKVFRPGFVPAEPLKVLSA